MFAFLKNSTLRKPFVVRPWSFVARYSGLANEDQWPTTDDVFLNTQWLAHCLPAQQPIKNHP
jgi:hypothetical protein